MSIVLYIIDMAESENLAVAYDDATTEIADVVTEQPIEENLFEPLVSEARLTLRRCMHFGGKDARAKADIAQDILDRAGKTKKRDLAVNQGNTFIFNNSDVQLLVRAAEEAIRDK